MAVFKHGSENLEDDPRSGRPVTLATPEIVTEDHDMVMGDTRVTERHIVSAVGVNSIPMEDLEMRKLSVRLVPRLLIVNQKHTRQNMSHVNLNLFETVPDTFLLRFVTMDETWVRHFTPEFKQQSKQWKNPGSPLPKKTKTALSTGKVLASIFVC